jgi:hypothetical protein
MASITNKQEPAATPTKHRDQERSAKTFFMTLPDSGTFRIPSRRIRFIETAGPPMRATPTANEVVGVTA